LEIYYLSFEIFITIQHNCDLMDDIENVLPLEVLLDLSLTEILILQILKYNSKVQRSLLLENINAFIGGGRSEFTSIAASSFYHRLDRLEKKKLISLTGTGKNKKTSITQLGILVLQEIRKLTLLGSIDYLKEVNKLTEEFLQILKPVKLEKILIISMEEAIDPRVFNQLLQFAETLETDTVYILSDDENYERLRQRGLDSNIKQTEIDHGKIRDFDGKYNAILIVGYDGVTKYYNTSPVQIIEESIRILKTDGYVLVNTIEDMPTPDHLVLKLLMEEARECQYVKMISEEQITETLQKQNIKNIQHFKSQGIMITYGQK
jgi:DNA-binding PadR family transcriptional regulator